MSSLTVFLRRSVALAGAAALLAGIASADVSVKLGGTTVKADSFNMNVSRTQDYDYETGAPKEPATFSTSTGPFYIQRTADAATSTVLQAVLSGSTFSVVEIVVTDGPDNGTGPATVWRIENAVVNNYGTYQGVEPGTQTENFDISGTNVTYSYFGVSNGQRAKSPSTTFTWKSENPYGYAGYAG